MTICIVSGDATVRDSLTVLLAAAGLDVRAQSSLEAWSEAAGLEPCGCLVLDAGANELTGPERLARFASVCARIPVIVLAERGDITMAVRAIQQGAAHVQQKPYRGETLMGYIKQTVTT